MIEPMAEPPRPSRSDVPQRSPAVRWAVIGVLAVASLAGLVVLAVGVASRWAALLAIDDAVEPAVHAYVVGHRGWVGLATVVTDLGSPVGMNLAVVVAAGSLCWARRWWPAIYLVAARALELAVETVLKAVVDRPRPVWVDPVGTATSSSFPSGHSAGTAVVYTALLCLGVVAVGRPRATLARGAVGVGVIGGALLLVAVPVSRVVLGVHYPSDVVAGVLLGVLCALVLLPLLVVPGRRAGEGSGTRPDPDPGTSGRVAG